MTSISSEGNFEIKVYYEDTDSLGVVYYANYLKYLERGRTEWVETAGKPIGDWNRNGFNFAVYKVEVTFVAAARLGDRLKIVTRFKSGSMYRLRLDQQLYRDDELVTKAEVQLVCLDENLKLREFPQELMPTEAQV